ncbi:MAG: orotate phosphoribosyltransferase [Cyclobacteriaceae bacterium]|nr:orotate phosphoribosyltransferase [Cyclobacteriaceae bacterium]
MHELSVVSERVARFLLEIKAIRINPDHPFVWTSGWKSPIYCDNRIALSYPSIRSYIRDNLSELVKNKFDGVEVIAGVATAGIPQGTLVADRLDLPFIYVRPKPKDHGLSNQIEGRVEKDQKVVVIEDLVSTGGSSMNAIEVLRHSGLEILGMAAIFSYAFPKSADLFRENKVPCFSLSNYEALIKIALRDGYIKAHEMDKLIAWRKDPARWG